MFVGVSACACVYVCDVVEKHVQSSRRTKNCHKERVRRWGIQEEEYVNEEFNHDENVGIPSQLFKEFNSLPTYDTEVVNEDLVISSLSCD